MKILFLDIETTPINAYTWGLWEQNVGLNQIVSSTEMMCFGALWYGSKKVVFKSIHHDGKQAMLEEVHKLLDEADVLVGWNSANFDSKHLKRELLQAGMMPPSPYKELDLMRVVKSQFKFPSNKLDYIAQTLGVGSKVKHSGFDLWLGCMAGDEKSWKQMKKYQIQDARLLVDLYEKLRPWVKNHPSVPLHNGTSSGCVACGSYDLQKRGYAHTATTTYQRYQCQKCGKWLRGSEKISGSEMRSLT
jgi:uncharacterized protein YprB with RNaseH-like and TPR domain